LSIHGLDAIHLARNPIYEQKSWLLLYFILLHFVLNWYRLNKIFWNENYPLPLHKNWRSTTSDVDFFVTSLTTNLIKKLGECPRITAVVFYLYKSIQLVQYNAFYLYKYIQLVCCHGSQLLAIILHSLGKKCSLLSVLIVQNYHLGI
jgi:hypothetical protein